MRESTARSYIASNMLGPPSCTSRGNGDVESLQRNVFCPSVSDRRSRTGPFGQTLCPNLTFVSVRHDLLRSTLYTLVVVHEHNIGHCTYCSSAGTGFRITQVTLATWTAGRLTGTYALVFNEREDQHCNLLYLQASFALYQKSDTVQ